MTGDSLMFKIWFRDGSKVADTSGGLNYIDPQELPSFAARYDFDLTELLQTGATQMIDQGETIGGVFKV
jgi:hypothetical protein